MILIINLLLISSLIGQSISNLMENGDDQHNDDEMEIEYEMKHLSISGIRNYGFYDNHNNNNNNNNNNNRRIRNQSVEYFPNHHHHHNNNNNNNSYNNNTNIVSYKVNQDELYGDKTHNNYNITSNDMDAMSSISHQHQHQYQIDDDNTASTATLTYYAPLPSQQHQQQQQQQQQQHQHQQYQQHQHQHQQQDDVNNDINDNLKRDNNLNILRSMGFEENEAKKTLIACNNNISITITKLTGGDCEDDINGDEKMSQYYPSTMKSAPNNIQNNIQSTSSTMGNNQCLKNEHQLQVPAQSHHQFIFNANSGSTHFHGDIHHSYISRSAPVSPQRIQHQHYQHNGHILSCWKCGPQKHWTSGGTFRKNEVFAHSRKKCHKYDPYIIILCECGDRWFIIINDKECLSGIDELRVHWNQLHK